MSILKWFWVYIKNWACLKNLSMLEPNFEEADGLGITCYFLSCGNASFFSKLSSFNNFFLKLWNLSAILLKETESVQKSSNLTVCLIARESMSQKTYFCIAILRDARKHSIIPKIVGTLIGKAVCTRYLLNWNRP